MPNVAFFNGPPGSGKDMLVSELTEYVKFHHLKAAGPLKRAVAGLLNLEVRDIETMKDIYSPLLKRTDGETTSSIREMLISMSETWLKPRYGDDIFGRLINQEIKNSMSQLFLISDAGFESEVKAVINYVGKRNCIMFQTHRNGCDFSNDSRSYIKLPIATYDLDNNGTKHEITMLALRVLVREFNVSLLKEPTWIR